MSFLEDAMNENELMVSILDVVDKNYIDASYFMELPKRLNIPEEYEEEIIFLTRSVCELIKSIPDEVFRDPETKRDIISQAEHARDEYVLSEGESEAPSTQEEEGFGILQELDLGPLDE